MHNSSIEVTGVIPFLWKKEEKRKNAIYSETQVQGLSARKHSRYVPQRSASISSRTSVVKSYRVQYESQIVCCVSIALNWLM